MRDHFEFFRQFRQRFETTGAIAPSSRFLANAMIRPLRSVANRPVRVLEVGPGTGAVTGHLVRHLQAGDQLDLVELNESFVDILKRNFKQDPRYRRVAEQSRIHSCPIQEYQADAPYDFIISGLPFNNFPPELVDEILASYFKLLAPGGTLSYFEYMFVRPIKIAVCKAAEKKRLTALDQTLNAYLKEHGLKKDWVFLNIPPAWVQHLRRPLPRE